MDIFFRVRQEIQNVVYEQSARKKAHIPKKIDHDVPYSCQFSVSEHAELSLRKELATTDDPHWSQTGASSPKRYAQWAFTQCGMACAAMGLEYFIGVKKKPTDLAEDALKHGVYVEHPDDISSMKYREFTKWIHKYGLEAQVYSKLSIEGIRYALSEGKLIIISVNPNIRGYNTAPTNQKGGHLVLATGYDLDENTISINNPSGFTSTHTQIKHVLPTKEFQSFYAGRGIVISLAT